MKLPGFSAETSLGPNAGAYRGKNAFGNSASGEPVGGIVRPAAERQEFCQKYYRGIRFHWFPVTVCTPIRVDSSLAQSKIRPSGAHRMFGSGAIESLKSHRSVTQFGALQDCRVVTLPFVADVTTTQSCDDTLSDTSEMVVQDHPELQTRWIGGISEIPAPYNPGWFTLMGQSCSCCAGLTRCPNGSCVPAQAGDKDPCKIGIA